VKKHYEVVVNGKTVARVGVVGSDIVEAIQKAVKSVAGATLADVDRAIFLGNVDVQ